jgi:hypothetical protein
VPWACLSGEVKAKEQAIEVGRMAEGERRDYRASYSPFHSIYVDSMYTKSTGRPIDP